MKKLFYTISITMLLIYNHAMETKPGKKTFDVNGPKSLINNGKIKKYNFRFRNNPFATELMENNKKTASFYTACDGITFCISSSDVKTYMEFTDIKNKSLWQLYFIKSRKTGKNVWCGRRIMGVGEGVRMDIYLPEKMHDTMFFNRIDLNRLNCSEVMVGEKKIKISDMTGRNANLTGPEDKMVPLLFHPVNLKVYSPYNDISRIGVNLQNKGNVYTSMVNTKRAGCSVSYYIVPPGCTGEKTTDLPKTNIAEAVSKTCAYLEKRLAFDKQKTDSAISGFDTFKKLTQAIAQTKEKIKSTNITFNEWVNLGILFDEYQKIFDQFFVKWAFESIFENKEME